MRRTRYECAMHKLAPKLGGALAALLLAAAPAFATGTLWRHVTKVSVTIQKPGLPPPYGKAHTTTFSTGTQLAKATSALNANHIAKGPNVANQGCAGGTDVTIVIAQGPKRTRLSAYQCGSTTYGAIAGDLTAFLKALKLG